MDPRKQPPSRPTKEPPKQAVSRIPNEFPDKSSSQSQDFVDAVNRFGFRLQNLTIEANKPSGLCTINLYQCLMMAAAGSQDQNLAAFGEVLGFDPTKLDQAVTSILDLDRYSKTCRAAELTSASSVWHRPGFILEEPWANTMATAFRATFGPVKVATINHFVLTETRGKIKDFVSEPELQNVVLMLVTCLYFKGWWAYPFEKSRTREASFYKFDNETQPCSMMSRQDRMEYIEDSSAQMVLIPFKTDSSAAATPSPRWKAAVILPRAPGLAPLTEILSSLSNPKTSINSLLSRFRARGLTSVNLSLPRLTLKLSLILNAPLQALGLAPIFAPSRGFQPISRGGDLFVSRVTHDIVIEVNEVGAEMAAVSSVSMTRSRPRTPLEMRVDRPFLFLIFDDVTRLVLCSVVVTDVSSEGVGG